MGFIRAARQLRIFFLFEKRKGWRREEKQHSWIISLKCHHNALHALLLFGMSFLTDRCHLKHDRMNLSI
jgi:hypothetical protein